MANDTKNKILDAALQMFSEKGYFETNMRELAESIGLTKAALYKHFASKEEIWSALLDKVEGHYFENVKKNIPKVPDDCEEFVSLSMHMVNFTLNDEMIVKTRKLLTIGQFYDDRMKKLATEHFVTNMESKFATVFEGMIAKGLVKDYDPRFLAFSFTAPISSLILRCDREPENKNEIVESIESFTRQFIGVYENREL